MGSGDLRNLLNLHLHNLQHRHNEREREREREGKKEMKGIPKGWLAVMVGQGEEEQQKLIIPVMYLNHPLFIHLLKAAEEEYGFHHQGPINIPCHLHHFRKLQSLIDQDNCKQLEGNHNHHVWCFKA